MADPPPMESWIDPALEVRIVAYILGEASDFEKAELERLIAERSELAAFARRIRTVHGLLGEAVAVPNPHVVWKLPGARRARLGPVLRDPKTAARENAAKKQASRRRRRRQWLAAAAMLMGGIFLCGKLLMQTKGFTDAAKVSSSKMLAENGPESGVVDFDSKGVGSGDSLGMDVDGDKREAPRKVNRPIAKGGDEVRYAFDASDLTVDAKAEKRGRGFGTAAASKEPPPPPAKPSSPAFSASSARGPAPAPDSASMLDGGTVIAGGVLGEAVPAGVVNSIEDTGLGFNANSANSHGWALALKKSKEQAGVVRGEEKASQLGYWFQAESGRAIVKKDAYASNHRGLVMEDREMGEEREKTRRVAEKKQRILESGNTEEDPTSTFSLNVSNTSFKIAAAALLERSQWPDANTVRTEDFVNNFDFGDPAPTSGEAVACALDQAASPFIPGRNLVRISLRTGSTGRASTQPLNLTVLLDSSGSMERPDRRGTVQAALGQLAGLLQPTDTITLISFARTPRLLADRIDGTQAQQLPKIAANVPPEGGTNLEEALALATAAAARQFDPVAQNRVILLTDGAANLGNTIPETLARNIAHLRHQEIAFDACGVGTDGLDDAILEALTRKGDGRYKVLDTPEDADSDFAQALAGAFRPAARNVKVQVRFNPDRVGGFQLLGFEKHRLKEEDFRNDKVDAAEMAAAEQGSAVYQIRLLPDGRGEIGDVAVRFLDTASQRMVERHWTIPYNPETPLLEDAPAGIQLAGTAALFAEHLKGTPIGHLVDLKQLASPLNSLRHRFSEDKRVGQLTSMVERARHLKK